MSIEGRHLHQSNCMKMILALRHTQEPMNIHLTGSLATLHLIGRGKIRNAHIYIHAIIIPGGHLILHFKPQIDNSETQS